MTVLAIPDPNLTLEVRRCHDCGRWWAAETARSVRCPICADQTVARYLSRPPSTAAPGENRRGVANRGIRPGMPATVARAGSEARGLR